MSHTTLIFSLVTAAAVLAGCAAPGSSGPSLKNTPAVPVSWNQPVPSGPAVADLRAWWKPFNDPTLTALVDQAINNNLDLAQALSRLREARLQSGRADRQFRPTFDGNIRTLQDIAATDTYFHASIDMVWELGLFGAGQSIREAASAEVDASIADVQGVRVAVIADVVRNYLTLQAARRQLTWLDQIVALDERTAQLAEIRLRTRLGTEDEIAQARARAAQTRAAAALVREEGARAGQSLAVLLGRSNPDPSWSNTTAAGPRLAPFALAEVPADLLRTRPDIHAAEAEVNKAAAALGLARSELYPRVALMGSLLYSYNITRHFRTRSDSAPAFGPVIDIPLFDWGRRQMQVDARKEAMNAALIGYQRAVNHGIAEAEGALAGLAAQQTRTDALEQAAQLLHQRVAAGQTLARLGLSSEYNGLAQRRAELQAQTELATAQDAHALAFVALYKALGGAPLPSADETAPGQGNAS